MNAVKIRENRNFQHFYLGTMISCLQTSYKMNQICSKAMIEDVKNQVFCYFLRSIFNGGRDKVEFYKVDKRF